MNSRVLSVVAAIVFVTGGVDAFCTNRYGLQKHCSNSITLNHLLQQQQPLRHFSNDILSRRNTIVKRDAVKTDAADKATVVEELSEASQQELYKNAIQSTFIWVAAASLFGAGLFVAFGPTTSEEFFAGYLVEQSLSVDNLFVFLLLFEYFQVPLQYQNRVLNWGIFGAMAMRAVMIGLGTVALQSIHEILLVFAGILIFSSGKILVETISGDDDDEEEDISQNAIVKIANNLVNASPNFDGEKFFTMVDGVKQATPLLLCLVAVEISDVVFAVDSIPAVFGVTSNPLVVFSSNIFAIMGLRSLYVILSKAATDLKYLEPAVAAVLGFIGCKMIAEYMGYGIPTPDALAIVAGLLGVGVGTSLWDQRQNAVEEE